MGCLFGDLLAVGTQDIIWIIAAVLVVGALLIWQWRGLLAVTVSPELAEIEGHPVKRLNLLLILMLALIVALAMKVVGILLVSALLIIPPAAARSVSRSPEQMVILASLTGITAVIAGLWASFHWDTPAGPSIVVAATSLFAISLITAKAMRHRG